MGRELNPILDILRCTRRVCLQAAGADERLLVLPHPHLAHIKTTRPALFAHCHRHPLSWDVVARRAPEGALSKTSCAPWPLLREPYQAPPRGGRHVVHLCGTASCSWEDVYNKCYTMSTLFLFEYFFFVNDHVRDSLIEDVDGVDSCNDADLVRKAVELFAHDLD